MATLAQDNFNRSDRSLDGDTMSDGSNTWDVVWGNTSIVSYKAKNTSYSGITLCDSMADVADAGCEITGIGNDFGPVLRGADDYNYYLGCCNYASGQAQAYKRVGGTYSQLGSDGGVVANGSVLRLEVEGSDPAALRVYDDGVLKVETTDSSFSTGKAGFYIGNDQQVDNFLVESLAAPPAQSSVPILINTGLIFGTLINRRLTS